MITSLVTPLSLIANRKTPCVCLDRFFVQGPSVQACFAIKIMGTLRLHDSVIKPHTFGAGSFGLHSAGNISLSFSFSDFGLATDSDAGRGVHD